MSITAVNSFTLGIGKVGVENNFGDVRGRAGADRRLIAIGQMRFDKKGALRDQRKEKAGNGNLRNANAQRSHKTATTNSLEDATVEKSDNFTIKSEIASVCQEQAN